VEYVMIRACLYLMVGVAGLSFWSSSAEAQSSSVFGNRGVTASSGTMSNGVGGGAGGSQSAYGSSGSLTGFTGTNAASASGFASGAQVNGGLAGRSNTGFVGSRNASNAATQNGQLNAAGAAGRGAAGGRNSLSGGMNRLSQQNRNRPNQNNGASAGARSTPIRPVQVIGFVPPQKSSESIVASINSDIESAVTQGRIPGVAVNLSEEGTATIEGHVATEADRRKAATLISLEPGVRKVVNRITVSEHP
jgi:hypothetical protein